ncbi:MAG: dipeptidase [Bacteroidota bacterium]|nr:dipeptidase [Bacteroidota bacterium]
MKTISGILVFSLLVISMIFSSCNTNLSEEDLEKKAAKIHHDILTIDTHNDTPMRFTRSQFNMAERHDARKDRSKMDFPRMKEGGLDGAFFAVFIGQGPRTPEGNTKAYKSAIKIFKAIHETANKHPELVEIATSPEDAYRLEKDQKIAMFIGIENGYPIGNDISNIKEFYDLGARYITLCHSRNNDICDSSTDKNGPDFGGFSDFGIEVVEEMNRLGIMVDISHASDDSFYDAIKYSKAPIIASHSSSRELCDHARNLNDDMLVALAENGGVIQICILTSYIKKDEPNPEKDSAMAILMEKFGKLTEADTIERDLLRKEWGEIRSKFPSKLANVQDAVDHIDHIVNLIGIDHVGIGTDFDGGGGIDGCFDASEMGNITLELLRRGYSKKEIEKIWSGNIMRVLKEVEEVASST